MTQQADSPPCTLPVLALDAAYITAAEHRARRFSGAYTGTSGTLAADVIRLLNERTALMSSIAELESANAALRDAVKTRLDATPADDPKMVGYTPEIADSDTPAIPVDWILQGERELKAGLDETPEPRPLGAGVMATHDDPANPAEALLRETMSAVRDRRPKYGGPKAHFGRTVGMINAAFADVLKRPLTESDWALIMTLDKVSRFLGPTKTHDQIVDLAGYAACLAECETP